MKKNVYVFLVSLFLIGPINSIFSLDLQYMGKSGDRNFTYTERTDLRRYDNGKYSGLFSKELRSFITCRGKKNYSGIFYVLKQTKRNLSDVFASINTAVPVDFELDSENSLTVKTELGYPGFRNFPKLPENGISVGEKWKGESIRCLDPLDNQVFTLVPMQVSYECVKKDRWKNRDVWVVSATWATRYSPSVENDKDISVFDPNLKRASGSNVANLYIDCENNVMLLCRDTVDEVFSYFDGKNVSYKGTVNLFTDFAAKVDRESVTSSIKVPSKDLTVKESDSGIVLTLNNLQFKADSAELLDGETQRLDNIAEVLKKVPTSVLMIIGHAASTGNVKGEQEISEERAKAIAKALIERGIKSENIVCFGAGSSQPVASNDTPEGKKANRRVEITILE